MLDVLYTLFKLLVTGWVLLFAFVGFAICYARWSDWYHHERPQARLRKIWKLLDTAQEGHGHVV